MYGEALEKQADMLKWLMTDNGYDVCGPESMLIGRDEPDSLLQRYFWKSAVHSLATGETYYWEPHIIDFVWETSQQMPNYTLRAESLLSRSGFCWLEKAIPFPLKDGSNANMVAFSWSEANFVTTDNGQEDGNPVSSRLGVIVTLYRTHRHLRHYGISWAPFTATVWRFGESFKTVELEQKYENMQQSAMVENQYSVSTNVMIPFFRFVAAAIAFMEQKIFIPVSERPERAVRRRLEAQGAKRDLSLKVVRLRKRYHRSSEQNDHEPVEWSCRWLVKGHWRQQHYRSQNVYKPIFIMPFVKGPEDKPLKANNKIFAVSR